MEFELLNLLEYLFNRIYVIFTTTRFTIFLSSDLPFTFSLWELIIFSFVFGVVCLILAFFLKRG